MAFRTNKMPVLQTKSASGAVATFNTALAMPLASCNIAVNAWQEGSGDPSPDNDRPIHGFSEVNATRAGKNLLKVDGRTYAEPSNIYFSNTTPRTFEANSYCYCLIYTNYYARAQFSSLEDIVVSGSSISAKTTQSGAYQTICLPVEDLKIGATYKLSASLTNCELYASFYKADGTYISGVNASSAFTIPNETKYTVLIFRAIEVGVFSASNIQLEVGSTATAYEPYVTPTIYTKALGETVYGGSYNSVSGIKSKTQVTVDLGSLNWVSSEGFHYAIINNGIYGTNLKAANAICDHYKIVRGQDFASTNNAFCYGLNNRPQLWVNDSNLNSLSESDFKTAMSNIYVRYELATPIETDIGATPIFTNIGNNTIFADTGDVDLTYKDLDIAKRGSFREVFRLPS